MPPAKKSTSIFLALNGNSIDSAYATAAAADARVAELSGSAKVQEHQLKGGNITVVEEKEVKASKPKTKAKKEEADDEEAPVKKTKTKTPAEQRAANAEKGGNGKGDDVDLPDKVKALLASSGNVLSGKIIVVTGVPPTLTRKNAEKLVDLYGGKLTKSLSKTTTFVVVGNDAGPTKLEKIAELKVPTYDEDEFIALLEAGGGGGGDEEPKKKKAKK